MISIAMATYNGAKYIQEQIESILRQTIQDFELIICDDCSTDDTCDIIYQLQKKDNRIRLIKNEYSLGFKNNFLKAISLCKGEYIALSDQDDVWYENHLSILYSAIQSSGKALAVGDADMVDSELLPLGLTNFHWMSFDRRDANEMEMVDSIALWRGMLTGMNMMFTQKLYNMILQMPKDSLYHDVWISLLACFFGGVIIVDKPISAYRRHGKNVTGHIKNNRHNRLRSIIGHCLRVRNQNDRMSAMNKIEEIAIENEIILNPHFYTLKRVIKRRTSVLGRIFNLLYEIRKIKQVYMIK